MPMIARQTGEFTKRRVLISGFSNTGKTTSLYTFKEDGKSLIVMSVPGETGYFSLQEDSESCTSYYYEVGKQSDIHSAEWSRSALAEFDALYMEVEKNKPDKLFLDGIHWLYAHDFNAITGGEYFLGVDMSLNPQTGRRDPYRSARFYSQAHVSFGQRLAAYYASEIPFIGMTVWEDWQTATQDGEKPGSIEATRYLWPALPGAMATAVVGRFDARISARLERRCLHTTCPYSEKSEYHHVWQFYPKNDVMGVGIKGLHVSEAMKQKPWIHQTWAALRTLLHRANNAKD